MILDEIAIQSSKLSYREKIGGLSRGKDKGRFIVENLNFKVMVGESVAILGESGSGKSTIGKLLMQEIKPSEGNIFIRPDNETNEEISEIDRRLRLINLELFEKYGKEADTGEDEERDALNSRYTEIAAESSIDNKKLRTGKNERWLIQMVPQNIFSALNPSQTPRESLVAKISKDLKLSKEEAQYRIDSLEREIGLRDETMLKKNKLLTSAEIQRVLLAMAICAEPDVIILDEFFTKLDQHSVISLMDTIKTRMETKRMSCILLTSDPALAVKFAERTYVLYKGSIIESGFTRELLSNPVHPYTKALKLSASLDRQLISIPLIDKAYPLSDSRIRPSGCLFHRKCGVAMRNCGWSAEELVDLVKHAVEEQKLLNNDALPDLESINVDSDENLIEISFKKEKQYDESDIKTFMEKLFELKVQSHRGIIFESIKFIDFEQEHGNLVIQLMDPMRPFLIDISKTRKVACFQYPKTIEEIEEELEKERTKEIRFFKDE